jgi:hypothetical protein
MIVVHSQQQNPDEDNARDNGGRAGPPGYGHSEELENDDAKAA